MGKSYGEWLVRWRYLVLVAVIASVAIAASGARFLTFKTDYRVFFSTDNPQLQAFEQLQNTYTKTDNVLFVLAPKDGNVFTQETLASIIALTEASWQIPYSIRVDSITNYQHTEAEGDDLTVDDLVPDAGQLDAGGLERIRNIATNEPLLVNRIISPDGRVTGVNVTVQLPDPEEQTGKEVPKVTAFARNMVDELRAANPDLDHEQLLSGGQHPRPANPGADHVRGGRHHAGAVIALIHRHCRHFPGDRLLGPDRDGYCRLAGYGADTPVRLVAHHYPDTGRGRLRAYPGEFPACHAPWAGQDRRHGREPAHQPAADFPDIIDHGDRLSQHELQ
jgi:hypothetical protein